MSGAPLTILILPQPLPSLIEEIHRIAPHARVITRKDFQQDPTLLEQVDIIYGMLDPELFPRAARLKWLQTDFAGMEWANHPAVQAHPAILTNARIHAAAISEHLFGLLLMLTRLLTTAYRGQLQHEWERSMMGQVDMLCGKTLCILGLGVIGRRCAALGKAFGMRVIGIRRHPQPEPDVEMVYGDEQFHEALAQADVVMNLLPNTPHTHKVIGVAEFAAMRPGAYFLNAGRGQTVDTDALVAALQSGHLRGAGLDVVDPEPLPPDHPLWDLPNVVITAHYGGAFPQYAEAAARIFLDNLHRFLAGESLQFVVDKAQGY
ncbi:MAG: D-2-hydroxyacid dehydrogenase [Armatimonadota bacterium]